MSSQEGIPSTLSSSAIDSLCQAVVLSEKKLRTRGEALQGLRSLLHFGASNEKHRTLIDTRLREHKIWSTVFQTTTAPSGDSKKKPPSSANKPAEDDAVAGSSSSSAPSSSSSSVVVFFPPSTSVSYLFGEETISRVLLAGGESPLFSEPESVLLTMCDVIALFMEHFMFLKTTDLSAQCHGIFYCITRLLTQTRFGQVRRRMRQILQDYFSRSLDTNANANANSDQQQARLMSVRWAIFSAFAAFLDSLVTKLDGSIFFASPSSSSSDVITRTELLHEAFLMVAPSIGQIPSDQLTTKEICFVLLYAHHPLLVNEDGLDCVWRRYSYKHFGKDQIKLEELLYRQEKLIIDFFINKMIINSDEPISTRREAAAFALSALFSSSLDSESSISAIRSQSASNESTSKSTTGRHPIANVVRAFSFIKPPITEADLLIYRTPEGELYHDPVSDQLISETKLDKTPRRMLARWECMQHEIMIRYSETESWLELVQRETKKATQQPQQQQQQQQPSSAKKGDKKPAASTAAAAANMTKEERERGMREAQLQKESAIRTRVFQTYIKFHYLLKAVSAIFRLKPNHDALRPELCVVVPVIAPLLESKLLHAAAFDAFQAITSCVHIPNASPQALRFLHESLARATYRLLGGKLDATRTQYDDDAIFMEKFLSHVRLLLSGHSMDGGSFSMFMPILERILLTEGTTGIVLNKTHSPTSHAMALSLISVHAGSVGLRSGVLRPLVAKLLIHVLLLNPQLYKSAHNSLISLSSHMVPADLDPLLTIGLLSHSAAVRSSCIHALGRYPPLNQVLRDSLDDVYKRKHPLLQSRLFLLTHDLVPEIASLATTLFEIGFQSDPSVDYFTPLLPLLSISEEHLRHSVCDAIADGGKKYPQTIVPNMQALMDFFAKHVSKDNQESTSNCVGALKALGTLGQHLSLTVDNPRTAIPTIRTVFEFLVREKQAVLRDSRAEIRGEAIKTGLQLIHDHGATQQKQLVPIFDQQLQTIKKGSSAEDDTVTSTVAVFLGSLATNITDEKKLMSVISRLQQALRTPSTEVQSSVCDVLGPLVRAISPESVKSVFNSFLETLEKEDSQGVRRGAAYGIAGTIKGLGIKAVNDLELMERIRAMRAKSTLGRESSLFIVETLLVQLGLLFEPYLIAMIPNILSGYADPNGAVRKAGRECIRITMNKLSPHGIRMMLPLIVRGLKDKSNNKKCVSAQILGTISHCAPRQLSYSLPEVVPALTETLVDPAEEVITAVHKALERVGGVVANPEISSHVPALLQALYHPAQTDAALEKLMYTRFVHAVDAASLALIMPILYRGLRDRNSYTRSKAAQIIASMGSLITDPRTLLPYISQLLPELKLVLFDPIPEIRGTASRALGTLVKSLGEQQSQTIVSWLLDTLRRKTDSSLGVSVERAGAAQGLAEVISTFGPRSMQQYLTKFLKDMTSSRAHIREGSLWVLLYFSKSIGSGFEHHLPRVLPYILRCFSDEDETVRDVAIKTGEAIVNQFSASSIELILPSVERGLFAASWRIRFASIKLLSQFFQRVSESGTHRQKRNAGGGDDDDEDEEEEEGQTKKEESEPQQRPQDSVSSFEEADDDPRRPGSLTIDVESLVQALGRNRVYMLLSSLFILMHDVEHTVRHESMMAWKQVVTNTPQMLHKILPQLARCILQNLKTSSSSISGTLHAGSVLGGARVELDEKEKKKANKKKKSETKKKNKKKGGEQPEDGGDESQQQEAHDDDEGEIELELSEEDEIRLISGHALGDLVSKLGDRVVPQLIPKLVEGLGIGAKKEPGDVATRQGVCYGLIELVEASPRHVIQMHASDLLAALRKAILDENANVRETGAMAFERVWRSVGAKAIEEVVPPILSLIASAQTGSSNTSEASRGMDALCAIVGIRNGAVLPSLVPNLLKAPIAESNFRALAAIAEVCGTGTGSPMRQWIGELIDQCVHEMDKSTVIAESAKVIVVSLHTPEDLHAMIPELIKYVSRKTPQFLVETWRRNACILLATFARDTKAEFPEYTSTLLDHLIGLFADPSQDVIRMAVSAVDAVVSRVPKDDYPNYIIDIRETLKSQTENAFGSRVLDMLPAFTISTPESRGGGIGLAPLLPMFLHSLMYGRTSDIREQAALGLGDLIELSTPESLKPHVIQITGPLIRVVGDRFEWQVKAAILGTLELMLIKGGAQLRPFMPQLQTTFMKHINDSTEVVRNKATSALAKLNELRTGKR